jgi:hypothetical protein
MSNATEIDRLDRLRSHNAENRNQRWEVVDRLAGAIEAEWVDGDWAWVSLGQFLARQFGGAKLSEMKDTEIVTKLGDDGKFQTFPEDSEDWIVELRRRALDPELRHSVDINELMTKGILKEGE